MKRSNFCRTLQYSDNTKLTKKRCFLEHVQCAILTATSRLLTSIFFPQAETKQEYGQFIRRNFRQHRCLVIEQRGIAVRISPPPLHKPWFASCFGETHLKPRCYLLYGQRHYETILIDATQVRCVPLLARKGIATINYTSFSPIALPPEQKGNLSFTCMPGRSINQDCVCAWKLGYKRWF